MFSKDEKWQLHKVSNYYINETINKSHQDNLEEVEKIKAMLANVDKGTSVLLWEEKDLINMLLASYLSVYLIIDHEENMLEAMLIHSIWGKLISNLNK